MEFLTKKSRKYEDQTQQLLAQDFNTIINKVTEDVQATNKTD